MSGYLKYAEVRPDPESGGMGVFATEFIPYRKIICDESAAIAVTHVDIYGFINAYLALPEETRAEFDKLWCSPQKLAHVSATYGKDLTHYYANAASMGLIKEDKYPNRDVFVIRLSQTRAIFETNAAEANKPGVSGVYLRYSRINHSCEPNVAWATYYEFGRARIQVYTNRAIQPGEQIYDSYIAPLTEDWTRRQAKLRNWGFDCRCTRCVREMAEAEAGKPPQAQPEKEKDPNALPPIAEVDEDNHYSSSLQMRTLNNPNIGLPVMVGRETVEPLEPLGPLIRTSSVSINEAPVQPRTIALREWRRRGGKGFATGNAKFTG
ncbi:hypothetical protein GGS26DRAFT_252326 [Hypomontagnella submonticulosa]|nr:hypothetical protein GGS26DRAFT_252326 [Hypomontagnella submonticulosa]